MLLQPVSKLSAAEPHEPGGGQVAGVALRASLIRFDSRSSTEQDTEVDGHAVNQRREKVWATGPDLFDVIYEENALSLNADFEQQADNRTEGNQRVLDWRRTL